MLRSYAVMPSDYYDNDKLKFIEILYKFIKKRNRINCQLFK